MSKLSDSLNRVPFLFKQEPEYLVSIIKKLPRKAKILEIGTFRGMSAILFAKVRNDVTIITIDSHEGIHRPRGDHLFSSKPQVDYNLKKAGVIKRVNHIMINSDCYTPPHPVDMLFIDGDHSYEGVKQDFERFSPFVNKGGFIVFHDFQKFPGVTAFCTLLNYGKKSYYFKSLYIVEK